MPLGCMIGLPCNADKYGNPVYEAGARFALHMNALAPPMNYSTSTMPVVGMRIDHARNAIAKAALDADAEHVLFLDTDVLFPPNAFTQLLWRYRNNPTHKIISGVYWSKSNPSFPLVFEMGGRGSYLDWKVGDYIEAEYAVGMGLVLIHTDVFRAIQPPWFEINYGLNIDRETGRTCASSMTEDLPFCEKAQAAGFQIWVDTGIQAGHYDKHTGKIFALNESMPQAQGRSAKKATTLYIGNILVGGEPAHVLSTDPGLKPTWIGPCDKVPTEDSYHLVGVKDPDVTRERIGDVAHEWARVVEDGGRLEILHPNYAKLIEEGTQFNTRALYNNKVIEEALTGAGFVDVHTGENKNYFHISAHKPAKGALVSLFVVAHDLHDMTRECIDSLRKSKHRGFPIEIILIDNASETPFEKLGDKTIRSDINLCYGDALKLAAQFASKESQYFMLMNNDTLAVQDNWIENLLERIRGNGQIAAVGPKQLQPSGTIYHTEIGFTPERVPFHLWAGYAHDHPQVQTEKFVLALNFGVVLMRRQYFESIPLDPLFGEIGNYEDIDWCLRARQRDLRLLYTPSAEIMHYGAKSQAEQPERSKECIEKNRQAFVDKWKDAPAELFGL